MKSSEFIVENDLDDIQNDPDLGRYRDVTGWRGVGVKEAKIIIKQGHMLPSTDLMPFDWEVVEYGIGDEISEMSEDDIEYWIQSVCPWYDGSLQSVQGGVNLTSDFENARGYAGTGVVFGVSCNGDVAEFSDAHLFAQNAKECVPVQAYYKDQMLSISELAKALTDKPPVAEKPKVVKTQPAAGEKTFFITALTTGRREKVFAKNAQEALQAGVKLWNIKPKQIEVTPSGEF